MFIKVNLFVENISIPIFVAQINHNRWCYKFRRVGRVPAVCGIKVACPARSGKCGGVEMYFVYILRSEKNNRHYIGCTSNLLRRLAEHNNEKIKSTKGFIPWIIIYTEEYKTKSEAFRREKK
jgi:putative endonuclease